MADATAGVRISTLAGERLAIDRFASARAQSSSPAEREAHGARDLRQARNAPWRVGQRRAGDEQRQQTCCSQKAYDPVSSLLSDAVHDDSSFEWVLLTVHVVQNLQMSSPSITPGAYTGS
jgi:hypothetical protein